MRLRRIVQSDFLWLVIAWVAFIFLFGVARAEAAPIEPKIHLDKPVVKVGPKMPVYVLVEFEIPKRKVEKTADRPPVNLGVVIDRSGSMKGQNKMDFAKHSAKLVVDALADTDRLAVVEYAQLISVLWPSSPVEAREMIKSRIDSLSPRGSTNLTGGMLKGVEEVRRSFDREYLNRVILLSDGLANQGITDPYRIAQLVRQARDRGIQISTMGLGLQYNEDLMQAIAQAGGGNYYYIESPTQMARIFQEEMSILFTTVAKDVRLRLTKSGRVARVEVFGIEAKTEKMETLVPLEDLYAGEKRTILIRLEVSTEKPGPVDLGQLRLSYFDTDSGKIVEQTKELKVEASLDQQLILASRNKQAAAEAVLMEAEKKHKAQIKLFEQGKTKEALAQMDALARELEEQKEVLGDDRLAKKAEALKVEQRQVANAAAAPPAARAQYLKRSKARIYKAQKGSSAAYVLRQGDSGLEVEQLQKALTKEKYYSGPINGRFDAGLAKAVKDFQVKNGMKADGVAGPETLGRLGLY